VRIFVIMQSDRSVLHRVSSMRGRFKGRSVRVCVLMFYVCLCLSVSVVMLKIYTQIHIILDIFPFPPETLQSSLRPEYLTRLNRADSRSHFVARDCFPCRIHVRVPEPGLGPEGGRRDLHLRGREPVRELGSARAATIRLTPLTTSNVRRWWRRRV
jgi:hypothetical protein